MVDIAVFVRGVRAAGAGAEMHLLHKLARITGKRYEDDYCVIEAETPESVRRRLRAYEITPETRE